MSDSRVDDLMLGLVPEPVVLTNDSRDNEDTRPNTVETDRGSEDIYEDAAETKIENKSEPKKESKPEVATDDYGNEIPKQEKMYSESEVQAMIRDRLSRGKFAEQPVQQPVQQQQPQDFKYDSENEDSWESQLESFIESTLAKREQKNTQRQWQQQEQETQANFEIKFNTGASKYQDFEQVVIGKPLTAQMVMATRGMEDPAAFIYAAAKTQATELDRISKINDSYAQAVELGRLEERMRKSRSSVSNAPRPIEQIKGDTIEKDHQPRTWSIDDKLQADERASRKERMGNRKI